MYCTVIVLLLATPLFYLLTEHFYAEDLIELIEASQRKASLPATDWDVRTNSHKNVLFLCVY